MKHAAWIVGLGTLAQGCFYVEPINQRPSMDIRRDSSDSIHRGGFVSVYAKVDDPEQHEIDYSWRVQACTDATNVATCDLAPFDTGIENTFEFTVPRYLADNATTVQAIRIVLEGTDELGATAKPAQVETLAVVNGSPDLVVDKASDYRFVVKTPIKLFADYSDPDDELDKVTLDWTAYSPTQATATLADLPVAGSTETLRKVGKTFTPQAGEEGEWMITVVARDEVGPPTEKIMMFEVKPDAPPCLAQWSPLAPIDPASYLPIGAPTILQVPVVDDDLDRYPGIANPKPTDILGQATFKWYVKAPNAGAFQQISTANRVTIDPAQYTPGDRFEVRVEIFDRNNTAVTCAPGDQLCALDATQPTCYQRQTWRVEAR